MTPYLENGEVIKKYTYIRRYALNKQNRRIVLTVCIKISSRIYNKCKSKIGACCRLLVAQ